MADARTDTGGSSAGKRIGDLWNKLFGWVMKMKRDEQSGISEERLPIGADRSLGGNSSSYSSFLVNQLMRTLNSKFNCVKFWAERVLREWMSNDLSGEESEPEVVRSEPSVEPGQVREMMLERLGLGSNGSGTDSDGAGHGVLEDFGIETNIEGFRERLQEIVCEESCAADSLEGVAEMFQEAGMEWVSGVFSAAGHGLIWVLGKNWGRRRWRDVGRKKDLYRIGKSVRDRVLGEAGMGFGQAAAAAVEPDGKNGFWVCHYAASHPLGPLVPSM
ncbi:hypothetical protein DM860_007978 [Cuscuta australis]|uniref:Uncharacterized protein n=1 Tax=Cuscuta australis TaxID=267555 RepID=A0A328DX41_9ASTE|nr:hypothetical protein DM860_007978 [Cuscuta australis]